MSTVAFVSPFAITSATLSRLVNASISAGGSVEVAITSRSRNVSRRRRAEPASDTFTAAGCRAQLLDELEQDGQAVTEQPSRFARILRLLGERLQDLLLALGTEAREGAQPLLLGRLLQPGDRRHAELLPDPARGLRAEPGQPHELDDLLGYERLPLRQRLHLPLLDDLDDLVLDRLADPRELLRLAVERELGDRGPGLADPRGGAAVGEHAERVLAFELAQVCEQLELVRQLVVPRQRRGHLQR